MIPMKRFALYLFLFAVLPLALYGIYVQYQTAMRLTPEIVNTLVEPYSKALSSGNQAEAYRRFTSTGFRKRNSPASYLKAQEANTAEFGKLLGITTRKGDAFKSAGNLFSGRRYYQGNMLYRYEKKELFVVWEVVREDDEFRIDATFLESLEMLSPGIY